jgi:hypothetical protein
MKKKDLEWMTDENANMEVDIGYVPRMEILSSMPSIKTTFMDEDSNGNGVQRSIKNEFMKPMFHQNYKNVISSIKWDEEISLEEADSLLERSFYPFKEVQS